MPKTILRSLALILALAAAHPAGAASSSSPEILADSTVVEGWTLANGLRVQTRHVPDAGGVAITLGYSFGTDDDPAGLGGLAQALGELVFTSAAGDVPERSREELDSVRPMGWSFPVSRRSTLFTEIASVEQLPGVLGQVAARMRGVTVTREGLAEAVKNARTEMSQQLFGSASVALYFQVREVAAGRSDEAILRRAGGRDLGKLTVAEADKRIREIYVPANAVLSLAGNLRTVDVRALVTNLFGGIPAGQPLAHAPRPALKAGSRMMTLAGIPAMAGVVGVLAPALEDTLHPSFYLNTLLLGSHFNHLWQREDAKATSRSHYAIFDEPEMLRVFPVVDEVTSADQVGLRLDGALNTFSSLVVTSEPYDELRSNTVWLLGGPMKEQTADRATRDAGLLHTMARTQAARALWGGEAFWADYRRRFEAEPAGRLGHWLAHFKDPNNQVRLLMVPGKP